MIPALIAANELDAAEYKRIYPDIEDAKVFMVAGARRMEGFRPSAVYATPKARHHEDFEKAYYTMRNNFVLCNRTAPRIL